MLGGGQLGRYAILAARIAGYGTVVLDPDPAAPAGAVADVHLVAAFDDTAALDERLPPAHGGCRFENPPALALQLASRVYVAPPARAVAIAQDRIAERVVPRGRRLPGSAVCALIDDADLGAVAALGGPLIVKTSRLGYDGKGQRAVDDAAGVEPAWRQLDRVPCIVEQRVPLDVEVSVVLARRADGATAVSGRRERPP